ncbi:MAG: hypothetical protein OEO79_01655 [Gemmatimonadota bacterium]|nr:hypothetical protein [Gemmatimonadota bacterium]MDH3422342.1 hypothetical protein [Gemmatimonadota bacterium]
MRRGEARPLDLANYLRLRAGELAEVWSMEVSARDHGPGSQFDQVVSRFMYQLADLLPWLMGPHGPHVRPLWDRTAELFGVMAAKRGLAAGEVIEEFQILRELLIRMLFEHPLAEGSLSLRDILRLNRIIDSGVTHASVGHTDAMFFQFFEPPENQESKTPEEIVREAERQLALVAEELPQVVEVTPPESVAEVLGN